MICSNRSDINRQNAKFSTGPKSKNGKAKSARNSLKHGLSIAIDQIQALKLTRDKIAKELVVGGGLSEFQSQEISTSILMLDRIRRARVRRLSTLSLSDALDGEQSTMRYQKEASSRLFRALKGL